MSKIFIPCPTSLAAHAAARAAAAHADARAAAAHAADAAAAHADAADHAAASADHDALAADADAAHAHAADAAACVRSPPESHLSAQAFHEKSAHTSFAHKIANRTRISVVTAGSGISRTVVSVLHPHLSWPSRNPTSPSASHSRGFLRSA